MNAQSLSAHSLLSLLVLAKYIFQSPLTIISTVLHLMSLVSLHSTMVFKALQNTQFGSCGTCTAQYIGDFTEIRNNLELLDQCKHEAISYVDQCM